MFIGMEMIEVQHILRLFQKIRYKDTVLSLTSISCTWDVVSLCRIWNLPKWPSKHRAQIICAPPSVSTVSRHRPQTTVSIVVALPLSSWRLGCISSLKALVRTTFKDSLNRFFLLLPTKK